MGADGNSRTFFKCFSNSFLYIIQTFNEYFVLADYCFTAFDVYDKQILLMLLVRLVVCQSILFSPEFKLFLCLRMCCCSEYSYPPQGMLF